MFIFPSGSSNSAEICCSHRDSLPLGDKNISVTVAESLTFAINTSCTDRLQCQEQTCPEIPSLNTPWGSPTLTEVSNNSAPARRE